MWDFNILITICISLCVNKARKFPYFVVPFLEQVFFPILDINKCNVFRL